MDIKFFACISLCFFISTQVANSLLRPDVCKILEKNLWSVISGTFIIGILVLKERLIIEGLIIRRFEDGLL